MEENVIQKLTKDLKTAAMDLTENEARYLVDAYYTIQEYRIASAAQIRETQKAGEPNAVLKWLFDNQEILESQIKKALDVYTDSKPLGIWVKSICGIGPVIAAGLLANIDITKAPTAGHIWSFAGYVKEIEWLGAEKAKTLVGQIMGDSKEVTYEHIVKIAQILHRKPESIENLIKTIRIKSKSKSDKITKVLLQKAVAFRPWNAGFKTLCWKIGESFVKVCNNPNDVYGKIFTQRKALEIQRNESGALTEQALAKLDRFNIGKDTDAYKAYSLGKLPAAHINERAKRYAVKLFLAHYQQVAYELHYGVKPPNPYPTEIQGHAHKIEPPNWPM